MWHKNKDVSEYTYSYLLAKLHPSGGSCCFEGRRDFKCSRCSMKWWKLGWKIEAGFCREFCYALVEELFVLPKFFILLTRDSRSPTLKEKGLEFLLYCLACFSWLLTVLLRAIVETSDNFPSRFFTNASCNWGHDSLPFTSMLMGSFSTVHEIEGVNWVISCRDVLYAIDIFIPISLVQICEFC